MSLPSGRSLLLARSSTLVFKKLSISLPSRFYASIPPRPPDIRDFLAGYPSLRPNPSRNKNLEFYSGRGKAQPDGLKIDELLDRLQGDFEEVERNHGFIQWLFPIPEHGVNHLAQPLEPHEASTISASPDCMSRFLRSYELMLAFYGLRLVDRNTALLERSDDAQNRFDHLVSHPHNLLRITRILKALACLSPTSASTSGSSESSSMVTDHHPASLVLFLLAQHNEGRLELAEGTMAGGSLERFWGGALRNQEERSMVAELVRKRRGTRDGGQGLWGQKEYLEWVQGRFGDH